jgi:hypothetical protein
VKARKVKGLKPDMALADAAERIVRTRLDELHAFPQALDAGEVDALHDLRIAAKRLRYVLELAAPLFGPYADTAGKRTKEVQDLIGEIHDCDVTLPRVRARIEALQRRAAAEVVSRAGPGAADVDPGLASGLPSADAWRGLHALEAHLAARRVVLFARFRELWTDLARQGFRARLEYAITERA